jgi:hypothetical protein
MNAGKHTIGRSIAILFAFCLLLAISALLQAGEQEDYQAAGNLNTIDGWESYLKQYPNGENTKTVREAYDNLLRQEAEKVADNPAALESIFKKCRTPDGSDKVFKLWDDALWANAKKADTTEAYRAYLLRFPGGTHVEEARAAVEKAAWRRCQEAGNIELYEAYLSEYPNGTHAEEAKEVVNDHAYQAAREKDTIEAYESFLKDHYNHKAAENRLRQLKYERAVKTGTLEDWKAFYDKYRYSSWAGDGKDIEQMRENAHKEIERLLYEKIAAGPTLELCRDYLNQYRNGPHEQQVIVKMEPCLFEDAMRTNKAETYFEYLEKYPEGYRDLEVKKRLDTLVFKTLDVKEDFSSFERYLRLSPKNKDVLMARMEPLLFDWAKRVNTVDSYYKYISGYPDGTHLKEVQAAMEPVLFKKAQDDDWYSSYEEYIKKCPDGNNVQKARDRIVWLKANKAVVEVNYPTELEETASPYSNVSRPFWGWDTVFKEIGGKVGFRVGGSGYILDPKGERWVSQWGNSISRSEVSVPAGGTGKDHYWFGSYDHELCNGYTIFMWTGEDAGGHPISVEIKVHCTHTGCPGPKKK